VIPSSDRLTTALSDRYRVERELGAGGMATVYLAHDLRHERDVAIKVLHPDLGAALGAERFLSEIKTTAKLQHPHILPLLDSGAADGLLYYVMPYVRGETLRARLERERQLPVPDAVRIAREVASALDHAHKQGVIHRDIKPENILLQDGAAVVADFGIALAVQSAGGQRMTQTGLSLGTPQYMSPEQAMGERTIDARSDIYALGAVTYEMLAGEPPFSGPTVQAVVARLLSEEPRAISGQRKAVPPYVDAAVQKALEKLPADRFASAAEFAEALRGGTGAMAAARGGGKAILRQGSRARLLTLAGAIALLAAAAGAWITTRLGHPSGTAERVTRFELPLRPGENLPSLLARSHLFTPDGTSLLYLVEQPDGKNQIMRRRLDEADAIPIPGATPTGDWTLSPDGQSIAFEDGDDLYRMPLGGGLRTKIALIAQRGYGVAWPSPNVIVYGSVPQGAMQLIDLGQGTMRPLGRPDSSRRMNWPLAIPGQSAVLVTVYDPVTDSAEVRRVSLPDGASEPIGSPAYFPVGVRNGQFVFLDHRGRLFVQRFDGRRVSGAPVQVGSGIAMISAGFNLGYATLAPGGDLAYHDRTALSQLVLREPDGTVRSLVPDTLSFLHPRLSPDGRRVAVTVVGDIGFSGSIWVLDRSTGVFAPAIQGDDRAQHDRAEWMPDSRSLLRRVVQTSGRSYRIRDLDQGAADRPASWSTGQVNEVVAAADGATFIGRINDDASLQGRLTQAVFTWSTRDTTPRQISGAEQQVIGPRLSPDGRWLAYTGTEGGARHAYVVPFPGPGSRVQVDRDGAGVPIWSRDGRRLYYAKAEAMVSVAMENGRPLGAPRIEFEALLYPTLLDGTHAGFDVTPDGGFLLVRPVRSPRLLVVRGFGAVLDAALAGGTPP